MSSSTKQEKKIMEEKINKVREVVRNFSTNDIVLALHYFELDVEKTIQAFLQDGYKEALGDWEQKGGSSVKKNKQKKNKSSSATGTLPAPFTKAQPVQNGALRTNQNGTSLSRIPNGTTVSEKIASNAVQQNSSAASSPIVSPPSTAGNVAETASNGGKVSKTKKTTNGCDAANSSVNGSASLAGAEKFFFKQLAESQANILFCFEELRHILAERERELTDQLAKTRSQISDDAFSNRLQSIYPVCFTYDNSKVSEALVAIGQVVSVSSSASGCQLIYESAHTSPLSSKVVTNGSHSANGVQKANGGSHTSSNGLPTDTPLFNNAENGSGNHYAAKSVEHSSVGQINPISPPKSAAKQKSVAQVNTDGIVMQSDALSADQLALLQKQIQETLRSQGIDPSVLSEIGVNTVAPRRRGPPGTGSGAGGLKNSGNNKSGGGGNRNGKAATTKS